MANVSPAKSGRLPNALEIPLQLRRIGGGIAEVSHGAATPTIPLDSSPVIKDSQLDEKSRSQVKREYQALKDLGKRLARLSKGQLSAIPLSDDTRAAVTAAHGMARNALQRHYRFLSSLLAEEDVAAITAALTGQLQPHVKEVAEQHEAERLRDELLSGDEGPLAPFVARYPECDRNHVRLLVQRARKELDQGKRPRSARLLYRYLRRLSDSGD